MLPASDRPGRPLRALDRVYRSFVLKQLGRLRHGHLTVTDAEGVHQFGDSASPMRSSIVVHDGRFYRRLVWGGGLGAAESLMDGHWVSDDLTSLVRIFIRDLELADRMDGGSAWLRQVGARLGHWWRENTPAGSRRNIHEHYDLGNDFYSLFLDETMNYSCGVFERPGATMYEASVAKMERVCRKLDLQPGDHLLEIGTGWGALAVYAATHFGCRITTTTISEEQFRLARERVREAGLEGRITVLHQDYRHLTGHYNKLVSIEMIEAVGHEYYDTFFRKCSELLSPDGMLLLQSIVILDNRYRLHLKYVDFIRRYIFPGGCLPSISVLTDVACRSGDLRLIQLEDLAPHYSETLRQWRRRFRDRLEDVRELGFSESFIRMWDYYLCYCEAAFEERQVNDVQMLLAKRGCRFDPAQTLVLPQRDHARPAGAARHDSGGSPVWSPRRSARELGYRLESAR